MRSASPAMASSAPSKVGHQHRGKEPRQRLARTPAARPCRPAAAAAAPARRSRPRSRTGRPHAHRESIRVFARVGNVTRAMLCRPSRNPTSRTTARGGRKACAASATVASFKASPLKVWHVIARSSDSRYTSEADSFQNGMPHRFQTGTPMRDLDLTTLRLFVSVCETPQHRARGRASQHRRLGHQQAPGAVGGHGGHAAAAAQAARRGADPRRRNAA